MKRVRDLPAPVRAFLDAEGYLWCRYCQTAFQKTELHISDTLFAETLARFEAGADLSRWYVPGGVSPHLHCAGNKCLKPLHAVAWELVRGMYPAYPQIPEWDTYYPCPEYAIRRRILQPGLADLNLVRPAAKALRPALG